MNLNNKISQDENDQIIRLIKSRKFIKAKIKINDQNKCDPEFRVFLNINSLFRDIIIY